MTAQPPAILHVPYELSPGRDFASVPLERLEHHLGLPAHLRGARVGDLGPDDHLVAYFGPWALGRRPQGVRARVSLMLTEPRAHRGLHMRLLALGAGRFHRLLTFDERMLRLPNARYCTFAVTWVPEWDRLDTTKTRMLSIIASGKNRLTGHRLRHRMARWLQRAGIEADLLGRAYRPIGTKAEGLAPYRYSLVIENSREPGYFTEKLIDAFACRCVPVYWGAPDIGRWFDPGGMIICTSEAELRAAVSGLSEADHAARMPALEENRARALDHRTIGVKTARLVLAD